ncbi:MAG: CHAT domain-containing protein [Chloroflexota bacterium]
MSESYTDLLIHIRGQQGPSNSHPVEATLSDGSFFVGQVTLDHEALLAAEIDQRQYGQLLFEALLAGGPIGRAYDLAKGMAASNSQGRLRVRLWLDGRAGELHAVRWERLLHYHGGGPIPVSITWDTPLSRYTGLGIAEPQPVGSRPLKMLLAIANPSNLKSDYDLAEVKADVEVANLRPALDALQANKQLEVTILPGQGGLEPAFKDELKAAGYHVEERMTSLENIQRRLPDYDIFHFIGHGAFRGRRGDVPARASLFLEKRDGTSDRVNDEEIVDRLRAAGRMSHLFFLAACESAKGSIGQAFVGLAPRLVEAGVPAVVAMQDKISILSAQKLTRHFYEQLLKHGIVDQALNEARSTLYDQDDVNWSMPALFMRLRTGQLFEPDPIDTALEAMRKHKQFSFFCQETGRYVPLPIEVIHLTCDQDYGNLAWLEQQATATIDAQQAFKSVMAGAPETESGRPKVAAFIGSFGSNKDTQLQRMVWETVRESLADPANRRLPVYVDLQEYRAVRSTLDNPLEETVLEALALFWPGLKATRLSELDGQPDLRIFLSGLDEMSDEDRLIFQDQFRALLEEYPRYEYALSSSATALTWEDLADESELNLLVLQPLNQTKIRHFLLSLDEIKTVGAASARERQKVGESLLRAINRSQLFDLVAIPRFMFEALRQAYSGRLPSSRTAALQDWVEGAIVQVAPGQGMRSKAAESIYRLAWEMQVDHRQVLPVTEAFQTLDAVRGNRGYDLETLYKNLLREGLLDAVGDRSLRFAYAAVQGYCCARAIVNRLDADGERHLKDISAMSAAPKQLKWWEDTLIFVCGILAEEDRLTPLRRLLDRIVYGGDLLKGEQLFLAARCLLECQKQIEELAEYQDYVVAALKRRSKYEHEPLLPYRIRATELLSRLGEPQIIVDLAALAYEKARRNLDDVEDYEYSSARMAAAIGLKRMQSQAALAEVLEAIQPELLTLFTLWEKNEVPGLIQLYEASDDLGVKAVTALAIGDLASQSMLTKDVDKEMKALAFLKEAFVADDSVTPLPVRWAVADALAMTDSAWVNKEVVKPAVAQVAQRPYGDDQWRNRDKCLAYLIGLIRVLDPEPQSYLVDYCLRQSTDTRIWITAIVSLGRLANKDSRQLLVDIAAGRFDDEPLETFVPTPEACIHIRRKALEVLAELGDRESVQALLAVGLGQDAQLSETFYWMTGVIYGRLL